MHGSELQRGIIAGRAEIFDPSHITEREFQEIVGWEDSVSSYLRHFYIIKFNAVYCKNKEKSLKYKIERKNQYNPMTRSYGS